MIATLQRVDLTLYIMAAKLLKELGHVATLEEAR
jgi:hypothetical protein